MTNKTTLALAVALIAAFATPALAEGWRHNGYHGYQGWSSADTSTGTDRESLVRSTR
jgi:hypothetical protein